MVTLRRKQLEAAQALADATVDALKSEQGVHAETAIAAAARMAGTFLLRSFGFRLDGVEPGNVVLSEEANREGPRLVHVLGSFLAQLGIARDRGKLDEPSDPPRRGFLETQRELEPRFAEVRDGFGLSLPEAAESAAVACALLIQRTARVLDPSVAFGIAVYGFIEGSKTAPDPVSAHA
jgi:hypothetical protein